MSRPDGKPKFRGVIIEVEKCQDCEGHAYCTRHTDHNKYVGYEKTLRECLDRTITERYEYKVNPGPKSRGMNCRKATASTCLWHTMVMNPNNRKWFPDENFRYPRIGAFEVSVLKAGHPRIEVFSKLVSSTWPNSEWLANRIVEIVESRFGGWEETPEKEETKKKFKTAMMTDEELRNKVKSKFKTIITAFRAFDKNGDGMINQDEFIAGVKASGVDLPQEQLLRLWEITDEDRSGNIIYTEFARKFATYKATASMHRHGTLKDGAALKLHGIGPAQKNNKHGVLRQHTEEVTWGVHEDDLAEASDPDPRGSRPMKITKMARDPNLAKMKVNDMSCDQFRARLLQECGSLVTAFRQFDTSGDGRIDYHEFCFQLPKIFKEPIEEHKIQEFWYSMDSDLGGTIDLSELANDQVHDKTRQGALLFKGQATNPALEKAMTKDIKKPEKKPKKQDSKAKLAAKGGASNDQVAPQVTNAATVPGVSTEDDQEKEEDFEA